MSTAAAKVKRPIVEWKGIVAKKREDDKPTND